MIRTLRIILFGILLLTLCAAGVSADTSLCEQLSSSNHEMYDQLIKSYLTENPVPKAGIYTYGEHLKVTVSEDGILSIASVSVRENTDMDKMDFIPKVLYKLGLHETTDIYTVTRTDYSLDGDVLIKVSLSGWFEIGPLLPKKAHFVTFKPEYVADDFDLVSMNGGESPTAKLSGSLLLENDGLISSYDLVSTWIDKFYYNDSISYPLVSPIEGDTGIFWIFHEDNDKQITAKMTVWFSFDGESSPKAHVTEAFGVSHNGDYDCAAQYLVNEDVENGQTIVIGTVTARNVHDSEDVVQYVLKAYCTKYGDRDSSTEVHYL